MSSTKLLALALATLASASPAQASFEPNLQARQSTNASACAVVPDQNTYVTSETLAQCGNATLFTTWRPRARVIAPEGWMNDPMGMFLRSDGRFHAGYQSSGMHIRGGNMSQGAAYSDDFTIWTDFDGFEEYRTLWPSAIYDIRAVFDGSIINPGFNGYPTIFYTSVTFGPLGAVANETEGVETQSMGEYLLSIPAGHVANRSS